MKIAKIFLMLSLVGLILPMGVSAKCVFCEIRCGSVVYSLVYNGNLHPCIFCHVNNDGCGGIQHVCGDRHLDAGEECDDGNHVNGDGCSSTCHPEFQPSCGDGHLDAGEQCDDGNHADGDGCSANCTTENHHDIPEYTTMGAAIVLAGAGAYMYRKRRSMK